MTIKHPTASAFVFCHTDGWRLGLIEHPLQGLQMIPGGHVEADESQSQSVLREVEEEAGLRVRLVHPPAAPLPVGYPHARVAQPWWITELPAPADNHLAEPHVHVDHQYVAVSDCPRPVAAPAHPFGWYAADELAALPMYEGTRLLAAALFPRLDELIETQFCDDR